MATVGTGPPNVDDAPKPTSSVRMSRTFGAPLGAFVSCGKSTLDSFAVRPMWPLKGCSGLGRTSCAPAGSANDPSVRLRAASSVFVYMFLIFGFVLVDPVRELNSFVSFWKEEGNGEAQAPLRPAAGFLGVI